MIDETNKEIEIDNKDLELNNNEQYMMSKRFKFIENLLLSETMIHCKVKNISERGIIVKIFGYSAFLPFKLLPWRASNSIYWHTIFPHVLDKAFNCKIISARKQDGKNFITVDATCMEMKKYEIEEKIKYQGIIISRSEDLIVVDIGIHFDWECGSILGTIHISNVANEKTEEDLANGKHISVYLKNKWEWKNFFFEANYIEKKQKYISLFGKKFVITNEFFNPESEFIYIGEDNFPAQIDDNGLIIKEIPQNKEAICKVVHIDFQLQSLVLEWENKFDCIPFSNDIDYNGTIINLSEKYLLIDIGESFDWKYGHIIGKLTRQYLPKMVNILEAYSIDEKIVVRFKRSWKQAISFFPQQYIEKRDKIHSTITLKLSDYDPETSYFIIDDNKYQIAEQSRIITEIPENKEITCEIAAIDYTNGSYRLTWTSKLNDIVFEQNVEYQAIIKHIGETYLIVDVGIHFDWKYGRIQSLALFDIENKNLKNSFEIGGQISVYYKEKTKKGILFYETQTFNKIQEKLIEYEKISQKLDTIITNTDFYYNEEKNTFILFNNFSIKFLNFGIENYLKQNPDITNIHFKITKIVLKSQEIYLDCINSKEEAIKLKKNFKYSGIIAQKFDKKIFIEIGHSFNWEYGSIVGLILKKDLTNEKFKTFLIGDSIDVYLRSTTMNEKKSKLNIDFLDAEIFETQIEEELEYEKMKQYLNTIVTNTDIYYDTEQDKFLIFNNYSIKFLNFGIKLYLKNVNSNTKIKFKVVNIDIKTKTVNLDCVNSKIEDVKLEHDVKYSGVCVCNFGEKVLIEIGHCFNWEYGSIKGIISNQEIVREKLKSLEFGTNVDVYLKSYSIIDNKLNVNFFDGEFFEK